MTIDNAFEKLDMLQEDWVNGRLSPLQRAKCVALDYRIKLRHAEMGYVDDQGRATRVMERLARERLVKIRKRAGRRHLAYV